MKHGKYILAAALCLLSPCILAARQDSGFDALFRQAGKVADNNRLVFFGAVTPQWKDNGVFYYTTRTPDGNVSYEVDVTAGTKTPVTAEVMQERLRGGGEGRPQQAQPPQAGMPAQGFRRGQTVSPDGKTEAFIRDHNVWVRPAGSGSDRGRQLSFDGTEGNAYGRLAWSPDSRKLAALRSGTVEERQVMLRESHPEDQVQPVYRWIDYAKPGDELPQTAVALFDAVEGRQIPVDMTAYGNQYELRFGRWSPDGSYFTFEYNQRGHQLYQLVAVDGTDGSTHALTEERSETFVYYNTLWRHYYRDGSAILWISERDDWRHLYRIDPATGTTTQITKGDWNVREIEYINEEEGFALAYANGLHAAEGEDPYNKHLIRIDLKTGAVRDLTPENAHHEVNFNRDHSCMVDNYSRPDLPYTSVVRDAADGHVLLELQQADIRKLLAAGFTMPEVFHAKGRDGKTDIWGTIHRPANFNPRKTYPVVEYIYAGPHDAHVEKNFVAYSRVEKLAACGFIVVCIDGMGTDHRSKTFQDVCWRNLKDAGFPDRIPWIKAAAAVHKEMDISHVGIFGYSAGGQNALSALLFFPEFYKTAVALCGCHDNRMDKMWWNEQWMGYPVGPWYGENSNVDNAWRLEGNLLIINGEMDDNVDPASSLQVVSELIRHDKYFEQLYLPGFSHNLGSNYIDRRVFEFLWRHRAD